MPQPRSPDTTDDPADPSSGSRCASAAAEALRRRRRARHWEMLVISLAVVVLSCALRVQPDGEHVAFAAAPSLVLPGSCVSREFFHVDCPGCGLTRSFILLARGDVAGSVRVHRVGWVLALAVLLQLPYGRRACSPLGAPPGTIVSRRRAGAAPARLSGGCRPSSASC